MRGPMWRFAIVAFLLLVLVVFYATRLGNEPEPESEEYPASMSDEGPGVGDAPAVARPSGDRKEDWFPDLSDRNDIPGVTLGTPDDRSTFGCDVEALADRFGRTLTNDNGDARFESYIDLLSASGDAELLLAAQQFPVLKLPVASDDAETDSPTQVDLLELAVQADPVNPLVLWSAAGACADPELHSFCTDANVQANMRTVLGTNGEYWVQESARLYAADDRDGALDALRRAATAPTFDSYFVQQLRMHQRALSLVPDLGPVQRAMGAYALSMMRVENSARSLAPCYLEAQDASWFEACVAVANRSASESATIMQRAFAMEVLSRIYEAGGQAEAADLERTRARELTGSFWIEDEDMIAVLVTDERVLSLYLEELEAGDEVNAVEFLRDEVERLKEDPTYTPCPPDEVDD